MTTCTKINCTRALTAFALICGLFLAPFAPLSSARADVSGLWVCDFNLNGSGSFPQDILFIDNGGVVTGQEFVTGTSNAFANITGSSFGDAFSVRADYISLSYFANINGTVSGNSMSGTWFNDSQAGGFTCFRSGAVSPTPTPGPTPTSKRPTAITIFCNRTGVGLSTADCAITVGDAGAPPRSAPTGAVDLAASGGLFPANASCNLQQTPYSQGVVACKAEFAVPFGFPLGIAFPIEASYSGDSVFEGSSTSHQSIQAGCIGDAENPCSGAVALTFANFPQVLKNAIATVFECGSAKAQKPAPATKVSRSIFGEIAKCVGQINAEIKLGEILSELDLSQIVKMSEAISPRDALRDPVLRAAKALGDESNQAKVQEALFDETKLTDLFNEILRQQSAGNQDGIRNLKARSAYAAARRLKRFTSLTLGSAKLSVKNNSRKAVTIRLNKTASKFLKAVKAAGKGDVNATISAKGKRSTGAKKAFNKQLPIILGIN